MEPWVIPLIVVFVIGLAVITYGALADRRRNQRAAREILSPPKREIPRFAPDAPAPRYLTELQARRPPEDAKDSELAADERTKIKERLESPETVKITARQASAHFVTDRPSGWSVLDRPRVLVCADPVGSVRELLGVLERMIASRQALVIMAPEFAEDVRKTLEVNLIRRMLMVLAITADEPNRTLAAETTGAGIISVDDLRADYLPDDQLGRCARWVADAKHSYVIRSD